MVDELFALCCSPEVKLVFFPSLAPWERVVVLEELVWETIEELSGVGGKGVEGVEGVKVIVVEEAEAETKAEVESFLKRVDINSEVLSRSKLKAPPPPLPPLPLEFELDVVVVGFIVVADVDAIFDTKEKEQKIKIKKWRINKQTKKKS